MPISELKTKLDEYNQKKQELNDLVEKSKKEESEAVVRRNKFMKDNIDNMPGGVTQEVRNKMDQFTDQEDEKKQNTEIHLLAVKGQLGSLTDELKSLFEKEINNTNIELGTLRDKARVGGPENERISTMTTQYNLLDEKHSSGNFDFNDGYNHLVNLNQAINKEKPPALPPRNTKPLLDKLNEIHSRVKNAIDSLYGEDDKLISDSPQAKSTDLELFRINNQLTTMQTDFKDMKVDFDLTKLEEIEKRVKVSEGEINKIKKIPTESALAKRPNPFIRYDDSHRYVKMKEAQLKQEKLKRGEEKDNSEENIIKPRGNSR